MNLPDNESSAFRNALHFFRQVGWRSEAYLKGDDWVRSRITDLKIDLWLATEHGETEESDQVELISREMEVHHGILQKSIFDPDPEEIDGGLAMETAAADCAGYVLAITRHKEGKDATFQRILTLAIAHLETEEARGDAHSCMERVASYRGIVFQDVTGVIERAKHLLECCMSLRPVQ